MLPLHQFQVCVPTTYPLYLQVAIRNTVIHGVYIHCPFLLALSDCPATCGLLGLGLCYGLLDTQCCSYYDEGVCVGSCGANQEPSPGTSFECVCSGFWREPDCTGQSTHATVLTGPSMMSINLINPLRTSWLRTLRTPLKGGWDSSPVLFPAASEFYCCKT